MIVAGGLALSAGCLRTDTRENNDQLDQNSAPNAVEEVWRTDEISGSSGTHVELDDSLIVCSPEAIARIAYEDGSILWQRQLDTEIPSNSYPQTYGTVSGSKLFIGGTENVYAVNIDTGDIVWKTDVPTQESNAIGLNTRFVSVEDALLCGYTYEDEAGEDYSGFTGIESGTGRILWKKTHNDISSIYDSWLGIRSLSPQIGNHTFVGAWNNGFLINILTGEVGGDIPVSANQKPVLVDDTLYGIGAGTLNAWSVSSNLASVEEQWEFDPLGRANRGPAVDNGIAYISADDTGIYAVEDGNQLWRFQTDDEIRLRPALVDSDIWAIGENIHIIDKESGEGISTSLDQSYPVAISANIPDAISTTNNMAILTYYNTTISLRKQ